MASATTRLRALLDDSELGGPVEELRHASRTILTANAMPFFPAFTPHGAEHVDDVLAAALRLVSQAAWDSQLFAPADAAVLFCATALHDLGMHLQKGQFADLVAGKAFPSRAPFFDADHGRRAADRAWPDLWAAFQLEARHFGRGQLDLILGPQHAGIPDVAFVDRIDPQALDEYDCLLVGEFLRRHHARLGHEIAIHGFPGAGEAFPVLAQSMPALADVIGAVARSHNEDLRFMLDYLEDLEPGNRRPRGVLAAYHMGLLRVADYLQIDSSRAPSLLLRLKAPQSPVSIEEWRKHHAVVSLSWDHVDPFAIAVSVAPNHPLRTHLALRELLVGLQRELDVTSALLDEHYASESLRPLRLTRRRVISNIDEPSLHRKLPYLARRAGLRSDPDLFRLLVRDLYGGDEHVAGRELLQNAADAVRARDTWEQQHGPVEELDTSDERPHIHVCLEPGPTEDDLVLRVTDRGIGMLPDAVIDYFLTAGASYGPLRAEVTEMAAHDALAGLKTGHFGVGVFAAFLLGPEVIVTTRHVSATEGMTFRARIDDDLVEIRWAEAPIGTTIEIPFRVSALLHYDALWLLRTIADSYRLPYPTATFTGPDGQPFEAPADVPVPDRPSDDDGGWHQLATTSVEAAYWRPSHPDRYVDLRLTDEEAAKWASSLATGDFVHNGMLVAQPAAEHQGDRYWWSDASLPVERPPVAAFDLRNTIELTLHRFELLDPVLPLEPELLAAIGVDLLAHALVHGDKPHPLIKRPGFDHGTLRSAIYGREGFLPPLPVLLPESGAELHVLGATADQLRGTWPIRAPYLNARSRGAWPAATYRAIGGSPSQMPRPSDADGRMTLHAALEEVRSDTESLERATYAQDCVTIVVARGLPRGRWDGALEGNFSAGWKANGCWRHHATGLESTDIFVVGREPQTVDAATLEAALALSRGEAWTSLTILRDFAPSQAAMDLARGWTDASATLVPRAATARARALRELAISAPWLAPHVKAWADRKET